MCKMYCLQADCFALALVKQFSLVLISWSYNKYILHMHYQKQWLYIKQTKELQVILKKCTRNDCLIHFASTLTTLYSLHIAIKST